MSAEQILHTHNGIDAYAFVPFRLQQLGDKDALDRLDDQQIRQQVAGLMHDIVEFEGPLMKARLARLVGISFGFNKTHQARAEAVLALLSPDLKVTEGNTVVWPNGVVPKLWRQVRVPALGEKRAIDEISLHELQNAIAYQCALTSGLDKEGLMRKVMELFRVVRLGHFVEDRLSIAIEMNIGRGRIRLEDGLYTV